MKKIALLAAFVLSVNSFFSQQWDGPSNLTDAISRTGKVTIGNSAGNSLVNIGGHLRLAYYTGDIASPGVGNQNSPKLYFGYRLPNRISRADSYFTMQYLQDSQSSLPVNPGLYIHPSHDIVTLNGEIPEESKVFYISSSGKIGMGTNAINQFNQADYRLFVKDGIKTEKVKVEVAAANGWADYVFEKDYKLMPLQELQSYIDSEGHLPEVPTTKEAIANGIELKEMNILLLKKVEELTLYTLKQQKNIEEQQEAMDKQNKRIEALEKKLSNNN